MDPLQGSGEQKVVKTLGFVQGSVQGGSVSEQNQNDIFLERMRRNPPFKLE